MMCGGSAWMRWKKLSTLWPQSQPPSHRRMSAVGCFCRAMSALTAAGCTITPRLYGAVMSILMVAVFARASVHSRPDLQARSEDATS